MFDALKKELLGLHDPKRAAVMAGYFKIGKGKYAEGDQFLGISVPIQRMIAKKYTSLLFSDITNLLQSPLHEFRVVALLILVSQYEKAENAAKEKIVDFYLKHTKYINNWDLVDMTSPKILGDYLFDKDKKILYDLARSNNIWKRRIAMLATHGFIRKNEYVDALKIAEFLLSDTHDLIHKAVGWMLREIGNRDLNVERAFLDTHYKKMPRTTLRYAIEKFQPDIRKYYLTS